MQTAAAPARHAEKIPFEPAVTLRGVWLGAVVWTPVVGAFEALWPELGTPGGLAPLGLNGTALLLAYGAAREAATASSRGRAVAWMATGGAVSALILAVETKIFYGADYATTMVGGLVSAGVQAAWRSLLALLLYTRPGAVSHERLDRAAIAAGLWAGAPTLIYRIVMLLRSRHAPLATADAINLGLLGVLPVGVALLAALRIADRRRWLGRVEEGQFTDWRLIDAPDGGPDLPLLLVKGNLARLLAHVGFSESSTEQNIEPVAAVGRSRRSPRPFARPG